MDHEATNTVIGHLRAAHSAMAAALVEPVPDPGPVGLVVAMLGVFGFRQVQAIVLLAESTEHLHFQVAQLVRSLLEAWFLAAWIVAPGSDEANLRRALGTLSEDVEMYWKKVNYKDDHVSPTAPEDLARLAAFEHAIKRLVEVHGAETPPNIQKGMEDLERPDRYVIYRWESNAVHSSLIGLGQLVDWSKGKLILLDVAADPDLTLPRLVAAWEAAWDLFQIMAQQVGLEMRGWKELRQEAQTDLAAIYGLS